MTGSMDVAIYLLDNGADVDEAVTSAQITPLSMAAGLHEIDILRMLLSRGASLDHFDTYGFDAVTHCRRTTSGC
jgi:ankyrin repeat protein